VAECGVFITQCLYTKETDHKKFVIVDGAMNDLIRPALYSSKHLIVSLDHSGVNNHDKHHVDCMLVDVVGPVCESADFLGHDIELPSNFQSGDYLAVFHVGAYGFVMSSQYNSRSRVCELLVDRDQTRLIRKREVIADLYQHEILLSSL